MELESVSGFAKLYDICEGMKNHKGERLVLIPLKVRAYFGGSLALPLPWPDMSKRVVEAARDTLWQDVRFAVRMLRTNPGFTAVAVLTLLLASAANISLISVVKRVLLDPLPYP